VATCGRPIHRPRSTCVLLPPRMCDMSSASGCWTLEPTLQTTVRSIRPAPSAARPLRTCWGAAGGSSRRLELANSYIYWTLITSSRPAAATGTQPSPCHHLAAIKGRHVV
jgi:hypothetical protein